MIADKSQTVRIADVMLIGPFMMVSAPQLKNRTARYAMFLLGVATIIYNGRNYLINEGLLDGTTNQIKSASV